MSNPPFSVEEIGRRIYAINQSGKTVATVSSHGDIDWRLRSSGAKGPLLRDVPKETHLGYVLGLKMTLNTPRPYTRLEALTWKIEPDRIVLTARSKSPDGAWNAETRATLIDEATGGYRWTFETKLTCTADASVKCATIEFNNILPADTGRCFLFASEKKFSTTLMTDRDGVIHAFPHQHMMHYSPKIDRIRFAYGTMAGFFGEPSGSPVVVLKSGTGEPTWAICDMYFDLHCQAKIDRAVAPGETMLFHYEVKYLDQAESETLETRAHSVPVTTDDRLRHFYPRLELGLNRFDEPCRIDGCDDASGFRPSPPQLVWDRAVGDASALRITSDGARETNWRCEPPTLIPPGKELLLTAAVKTEGVTGKGAFVRVKYYSFSFWPKPGVTYKSILETEAVNGTTDGWVTVALPTLRVPEEDFDFLIVIEVVLDGQGVAWFSDLDIQLLALPELVGTATCPEPV